MGNCLELPEPLVLNDASAHTCSLPTQPLAWLQPQPRRTHSVNHSSCVLLCSPGLPAVVCVRLHDNFVVLFFLSLQNAKSRTVSPASAETFAQNVRKVCICTKGDVTSHALKATLLPTAPWSAAVLVSNTELSMHLLLQVGLSDQTNPSGMLCWCLTGNASGSFVHSPWLGIAWMGTAIFMQIAFGALGAHGVVGKGVPGNLGTAGEMHTLLWLHWERGGRAPRGAAERNERYLWPLLLSGSTM